MISKATSIKSIQQKISKAEYEEAIGLIEKHKKDLIELDYWYYPCSMFEISEKI